MGEREGDDRDGKKRKRETGMGEKDRKRDNSGR